MTRSADYLAGYRAGKQTFQRQCEAQKQEAALRARRIARMEAQAETLLRLIDTAQQQIDDIRRYAWAVAKGDQVPPRTRRVRVRSKKEGEHNG